MTTAPERDTTTRDPAMLQRLPEDEQPPDALDPTCATTGVRVHQPDGAEARSPS
ncbi:MAG TPA: hypothetical protein VLM05_11510 [Mycobacteriales bacterium]|nr:hypothetical protein [Mycobacteriales bacterium]